jgi:hypothetical protein
MERACWITTKASTGLVLVLCWRIGTGICDANLPSCGEYDKRYLLIFYVIMLFEKIL